MSRPAALRRTGTRASGQRALAGRPAWVVLALLVATLLAIGSVHGRADPAASRVAYLESVIKCPSCQDLTIGQSTSDTAAFLRLEVRGWVGAGRSDAWIEQQVVDHYGQADLLVPATSGVDGLVWQLPVVAVVLAGGGLGWFFLGRRRRHSVSEPATRDEADELLVSAALAARGGSTRPGLFDSTVSGRVADRGGPLR